MLNDARARLVRLVTFLGGIYFFLYFLLPGAVLERIGVTIPVNESISVGFVVVGAMAVGLGVINLLRAHGGAILFRRAGWGNSIVLISGMSAMLAVTGAQWICGLQASYQLRAVRIIGDFAAAIIADASAPIPPPGLLPLPQRVKALLRYSETQLQPLAAVPPLYEGDPVGAKLQQVLRTEVEALIAAATRVRAAQVTVLDPSARVVLEEFAAAAARLSSSYAALQQHQQGFTLVQRLYDLLYMGLFNHLGSAMFALLGVYIAAAAYRAFRVRSFESALMMGAAVLVMLGQISFGAQISEHLPAVRQWLLEVPNSAAFRAIRLGSAVAGLMLAIRMWLSIESKSFGGRK